MADPDRTSEGILGAVWRLGGSLGALLRTRAELFVVELQEEKLRVIRLFIWLTIALALAVAGILVMIGTIGLFLWEQAGYTGLIGLAVASLAAAAILLWTLGRRIKRGPDPFEATLAEIRKDIECLKTHE